MYEVRFVSEIQIIIIEILHFYKNDLYVQRKHQEMTLRSAKYVTCERSIASQVCVCAVSYTHLPFNSNNILLMEVVQKICVVSVIISLPL